MDQRKFVDKNESYKYKDIMDLPHHVSKVHPQMPVQDRAAQFAPFAALTGHHEAVKETARLTQERMELDEYCKEVLDGKLQKIRDHLGAEQAVSVTYFVPDVQKAGGSYVTAAGYVKKIHEYEGVLVLDDGTRIQIDEIIEIDIDVAK